MATLVDRYAILGVPISALDLPRAVDALGSLVRTRAEREAAAYVCVRDVNGIVECQRDPGLREIHARAALVTPDGMPVVWWGKLSGHEVSRVYGPDLMRAACAQGISARWRHFLCGGLPGVADELAETLRRQFPGIEIVGTHTPPFRPLTTMERDDLAASINASGADIVWIGLGSPKQERFMAEMAPSLRCGALIGVGAAFDFLSGRKRQAPPWIQRSGFEWMFRLATEPRRLWKRYLVNNSAFVWLVTRHLLRQAVAGWRRRPA